MTPPDFWYDPTRSPPVLLRAISFIYGLLRYVHVALTRPTRPDIPTICVGNMTVGGSGKTPVVRALRALFSDRAPVVLLRGYGGNTPGPKYVIPDDAPRTVGDESLIHATDGPTFIARDRRTGINAIHQNLPRTSLIILDDGLQNRHIAATVNILVIDGAVGFGNEHLIPAGPLREPIHTALARTHICIIMGNDTTNAATTITRYKPDMPILTAHIIADAASLDRTRHYIAVAGIGRPQKFYKTLEMIGIDVISTRDFPDHHLYQKPDITALFDAARAQNATLITTEKDAVKIRALTDIPFSVLPVRAVFDNPAQLHAIVQSLLSP